MELYLEIFFSKIVDGGVIYFKSMVNITGVAANPDSLVQETLRSCFPQQVAEVKDLLIHSTSWRYDDSGKLIVTYLVYSDKFSFTNHKMGLLPLDNLKFAWSSEPHNPRPAALEEHHILSHGFRHLSFLVETDPFIKETFRANKTALKALKVLPAALSGKVCGLPG